MEIKANRQDIRESNTHGSAVRPDESIRQKQLYEIVKKVVKIERTET